VYEGSPPFAYRLGPEIFAAFSTDTARVRAEFARKGSALGCHAVVSVVYQVAGGNDRRPWGFCAWRVAPI
jgi:hypothetical protein